MCNCAFALKGSLELLLMEVQKHVDGNIKNQLSSSDFVKKEELFDMIKSLIPEISKFIKHEILLNQEASGCKSKFQARSTGRETVTDISKYETPDHIVVIHGDNTDENKFTGFSDKEWVDVI